MQSHEVIGQGLDGTAYIHMTTNQLFTDNQHGLAVLGAWSEALEMGITVDAVYLNFAKAFNMVPLHRLLIMLDGYGIKG